MNFLICVTASTGSWAGSASRDPRPTSPTPRSATHKEHHGIGRTPRVSARSEACDVLRPSWEESGICSRLHIRTRFSHQPSLVRPL